MSEWITFFKRAFVGALRIAIRAHSTAVAAIKIAVGLTGFVVAVVFKEKLNVSLSDGSELVFHPPVGLTITVAAFLLVFAICFAVSWVTTPRLQIADRVNSTPKDGQFGVYVTNQSWGQTIKKGRVALTSLDPNPLRESPLGLHCSQEDIPTQFVDIHPRSTRLFDVIYVDAAGKWWVAWFLKHRHFDIPAQRYLVTITAEGEDVAPAIKRFVFEPDGKGGIAFYQAGRPPVPTHHTATA